VETFEMLIFIVLLLVEMWLRDNLLWIQLLLLCWLVFSFHWKLT